MLLCDSGRPHLKSGHAAFQRSVPEESYYEAFSTKTDVLHPLENEDGLLDQCINSRPYSQNEKMYQLMFRFATGRISYEETLEQMDKLRKGDTEK